MLTGRTNSCTSPRVSAFRKSSPAFWRTICANKFPGAASKAAKIADAFFPRELRETIGAAGRFFGERETIKEEVMRKLAGPAIVALLAMNASFAWAWSDVTGTIKSVDTKNHELVLDNGKTYMVQKDVSLSNFKQGDKVMVSTEVEKGKNMVNKVTKSS
jgi:Cu/Ag efflux protein CusF